MSILPWASRENFHVVATAIRSLGGILQSRTDFVAVSLPNPVLFVNCSGSKGIEVRYLYLPYPCTHMDYATVSEVSKMCNPLCIKGLHVWYVWALCYDSDVSAVFPA